MRVFSILIVCKKFSRFLNPQIGRGFKKQGFGGPRSTSKKFIDNQAGGPRIHPDGRAMWLLNPLFCKVLEKRAPYEPRPEAIRRVYWGTKGSVTFQK